MQLKRQLGTRTAPPYYKNPFRDALFEGEMLTIGTRAGRRLRLTDLPVRTSKIPKVNTSKPGTLLSMALNPDTKPDVSEECIYQLFFSGRSLELRQYAIHRNATPELALRAIEYLKELRDAEAIKNLAEGLANLARSHKLDSKRGLAAVQMLTELGAKAQLTFLGTEGHAPPHICRAAREALDSLQ